MNSKKEKIKEYAKSLFLEVNAEGKKINTWEAISKNILKKFKLEIHFTTIQKWSKRYDWEITFEKLKMAGIERGKEQLQQKENQIIDEKANTIADIYQANKRLQKLAQQTILAQMTGQKLTDKDGNIINCNVGNTDVIRLIQHSENTLLNLHNKGIKPIDKLPTIIIQDLQTQKEIEKLITPEK
jgi:hypothetical protein